MGDAAPGTPAGVTFEGFSNVAPALNAWGRTAFRADLTGSGVDFTNNNGIWSEGAGPLSLVARAGAQAPGLPAGTNFKEFGTAAAFFGPGINSAGHTGFLTLLTGTGVTGNNDHSLWSESSGSLGLVAREDDDPPGTASGVKFARLENLALNNTSQSAFFSRLKGTGVDASNDHGLWSEGSGSLALVAREGAQAPGTSTGVLFDNFLTGNPATRPALNSAGQTAFLGELTGTGIDDTNEFGVWSEGSGSLALVARAGTQAPDAPGGVFFDTFSSASLNTAGMSMFRAELTSSSDGSTPDTGIWTESLGSLALVAMTGDQAAGTPVGVNYASVSDPLLNSTGLTAFAGTLTGGSVSSIDDAGLWKEDSGSLALVAREGDQAPGTPAGVTFESFSDFGFNSAGQMAFYATLGGTAVPGSNDIGIWAEDQTGSLQLIARKGDSLEVAPGDSRIVRTLSYLGNTGNDDGHPSGFNDLGQLAFNASFIDDTAGVFVSNLVAGYALPGDFDSNGIVDGLDFLKWQRGMTINPLSPTELLDWDANYGIPPGDFDGNRVVNGLDFLKWQQGMSPNPFSQSDLAEWEANYTGGGAPLASVTAVPEPSCLLVVATAVLILFRPIYSAVG